MILSLSKSATFTCPIGNFCMFNRQLFITAHKICGDILAPQFKVYPNDYLSFALKCQIGISRFPVSADMWSVRKPFKVKKIDLVSTYKRRFQKLDIEKIDIKLWRFKIPHPPCKSK